MHKTPFQYSVILLVLSLLASAPTTLASLEPSSRVRLEPQHYFGKRGQEPSQQLTIQGRLEWARLQVPRPWQITLHGDFEALGRKDNSIDVDRAWWQTSLGDIPGVVFLGRIHPFDVANHPSASRPWGYLAQNEAQNHGILLGSPFSETTFPSPVLQGWVGVHYWSTQKKTDAFQWGVSASPLYVPPMGGSVNYQAQAANRTSRFGRQPPGFVEIEGRRHPIDYQIDYSDVGREVLQPQLQAHAYTQARQGRAHWQSWLTLKRAPSVNPRLETAAVLDLRQSKPRAIITAKPHFDQEWSATASHSFSHADFPGSTLYTSTLFRQGGVVGGEIGFENQFLGVAYQNERVPKISNARYTYPTPAYSSHLVQAEGRLPSGSSTLYGGAKYHLFEGDTWLRAGVRSRLGKALAMDAGMDIFAGKNGSYFGDWRSNDRFYLGIIWEGNP